MWLRVLTVLGVRFLVVGVEHCGVSQDIKLSLSIWKKFQKATNRDFEMHFDYTNDEKCV